MRGGFLTHGGKDATRAARRQEILGRMRIEIVVFDGFDELDVFGPFEVLSMAGFDVALVAVERRLVTSMRGVQLQVPEVLVRPTA